jgi:methionine synthase II (cobalamin-independent)
MADFKTTHVGSLPRIPEVGRTREQAKEEIIAIQVQTGIDELNDGEYDRLVYFGDVTGLPGFTVSKYGYEFGGGDVYQTPIAAGKILYDPSKPFAGPEVAFVKRTLAKLGAKRRVKVTVPSPSMIYFFYPNPEQPNIKPEVREYYGFLQEELKKVYPTPDKFLEEVTRIVVNEAKSAFAAGADTVQFDAPTLLVSARAGKDFLRFLLQIDNAAIDAVKGLGTVGVHGCFGNGWNTQSDTSSHYNMLLPELLELHSDVLGPFEVFDGIRDFEELGFWKQHRGSIRKGATPAIGIVSVKSRNVEPVDVLKKRYAAAQDAVGDLIAAPGCGFSSGANETIHSVESARRKLANLAAALM